MPCLLLALVARLAQLMPPRPRLGVALVAAMARFRIHGVGAPRS